MAKKKSQSQSQFAKVVAQLKADGMPVINGQRVVVRVDAVEVKELIGSENPLNWREHSKRQKEYVQDTIENLGWAQALTYNAVTGHLINGHGRLEIAIEKKYKTLPVDIGAWSEDEERQLLIAIDSTSQMATINANALDSLVQSTLNSVKEKKKNKKDAKSLQSAKQQLSMLTDIRQFANEVIERKKAKTAIAKSKKKVEDFDVDGDEYVEKALEEAKEVGGNNVSITTTIVKDNVIFPSSNQWGIPDLDESMLYKDTKLLPDDTFARIPGEELTSTMYYCESGRPFDQDHSVKPIGGFLGFYTEDYIFEKYFLKPSANAIKLADEQWFAIIEPDYSTYWDRPFAETIWAVYRSRWCCRYWQEIGLQIIPILRRTTKERRALIMDTLPKKCPIMALQIRMGGSKVQNDKKYWSYIGECIEYAINNNGLKHLLIYGSPSLEKLFVGYSQGVKYTFIETFINKRCEVFKDKRHKIKVKKELDKLRNGKNEKQTDEDTEGVS
jgi:hypothetical protein